MGAAILAGVVTLLGGLVAGGLLVAAGVVALIPVAGLAGALALVASGLVAGVGVVWAAVAWHWRRARAARRAVPLLAVAGIVLEALARRRVAQLEAALAAGAALAVLLQQALRRQA